MSECVVRMEMPENCAVCPFVTEYSRCVFLGMYAIDEERRADNCPIVCSIPEGHGRLVDADALVDDIRHNLWDYDTVDGITSTTVLKQTVSDIGNCPTIVPAEAERSE